MEKLNLKYNATRVDEIEKAKNNLPVENCITDTTIDTLCLFIQKGLVDDNGVHGVSRSVAMDVINNYLQEKDKDELVLDIMEALVDGGFLSRQVDVAKLREANEKKATLVKQALDEM